MIGIFANIGESFYNIGSNLVTGFLDGIQDMWHTVTGWLGEKVSGLMSMITGPKMLDENSPSKWGYRVGEYLDIGLANGIEAGADTMENAAGKAVGGVQTAISTVRDWAGEIGRYISRDLANGIEQEKSKAQQAAEKVASNIYSGLSTWADRLTKYEALSLQDQLELWQGILARFRHGTDQWWSAYDKVFSLKQQVEQEHLKETEAFYDEWFSNIEKAYKREHTSTAEQLADWERILWTLEEGSERWTKVEETVFSLREKLLQENYNATADWITKTTKYMKLSAAEQITLWQDAAKEYAASSEYYGQIQETLFDLRVTAYQDFAAKVEDIAGNIADIQQKAAEDSEAALAKRADEIAHTYKLFEEVTAPEKINGRDLLNNLSSQIRSIRSFYADLDTLAARGMSADVVEEIRAMGVGAAGELKGLLSLTDRQLQQYADLYGEKQELANSIALRELDVLDESTQEKIQEQLDSLRELYEETAPLLGEAFADGIAEGIDAGLPAVMEAAIESARAAATEARRILQWDPAALSTPDAAPADTAASLETLARAAADSTRYAPANTNTNNTAAPEVIQIHTTVEPEPVKIDGSTLVRIIFPDLVEELRRNGYKLEPA